MSMPAQNLFYDFASVASTDNILNDAQYAADADRLQGNVPGIARQQLVNKALKQAAAIASSIGQVAAITMDDVIGDSEDGLENLVAFLENGFLPKVSSSDAGNYLRVNAQGTDREWVPLPVASTTLAGIVSIEAQSFAGLKTFTEGLAGNLTGDVTGNLTGNVTGNVSGNAGTATKLQNSRQIGLSGVTATPAQFDGSANADIEVTAVPSTLLTGTIDDDRLPSIPASKLPVASQSVAGIVNTTAQTFGGAKTFADGIVGDLTGNADTATKLATARSIGLAGIVANAVSFDGSADVTLTVTAVPANLLTGTIDVGRLPSIPTSNLPDASTTGSGIVRLSTNEEANTGTATDIAVTPAALAYYIQQNVHSTVDASETAKGVIEIATQAETNAGTDNTKAITPAKLSTYVDNYVTNNASKVKVYVNGETDEQILADTNPGDIIIRSIVLGGSYIVFNAGEYGTASETIMEVQYGTAIGTLPTVTVKSEYSGYTFVGWFTDPDGGTQITTETTISSGLAVEYYAHYSNATVTFDLNGQMGFAFTYGSKEYGYDEPCAIQTMIGAQITVPDIDASGGQPVGDFPDYWVASDGTIAQFNSTYTVTGTITFEPHF